MDTSGTGRAPNDAAPVETSLAPQPVGRLRALDRFHVVARSVAPAVPPDRLPSVRPLLACIPVPAFVCKDGRVVALNKAAERLTAYGCRDLAVRSLCEIFAPRSRALVARALRGRAGGGTRARRATVVTRRGAEVDVELRCAAVAVDNAPVTVITVVAAARTRAAAAAGARGTPPGHALVQSLTPRERETLALVARGDSSDAIAQLLHLSRRTVEAHRANIMRKLGLQGSRSLARYAARLAISAAPRPDSSAP